MLGPIRGDPGPGSRESLALPDLGALQRHLAGGACTHRKLAGERQACLQPPRDAVVSLRASNNNVLLLVSSHNQLTGLALMYYLPHEFLIRWPPCRCGDPDSMAAHMRLIMEALE